MTAAASVLLLRHLGVAEFGRYLTVVSLVAIVAGVADAGLTAVGTRDLSRLPEDARSDELRNLIGLRLVLTPLGVLAAILFALVAGYDDVLVYGTVLAGIGLVLITLQSTIALPLSVDLKIGRLTVLELLKQLVLVVGIAVLVLAGATLLPFFGLQIVVGAVVLAVTPFFLRGVLVVRPRFDRERWGALIREALPLAVALALYVVYFRVLVIMMSLMASEVETGLFATSFRIFEVVFGLPTILMFVALPVLSAAAHDSERMRYVLQRMTEVGLIGALYFVFLFVALAEPIVRVLGGAEYADAAPVLRIQALALLGVFFGQAWQTGLISVGRQSAVAVANGVALLVLLVLGPALIEVAGAEGAAAAAAVAETVLAGLLFLSLRRPKVGLEPHFGFVWRLLPAAAVLGAALLLPVPLPAVVVLASLAFLAAIRLTGALPPELLAAVPGRRPA
jgi:O-antigen/teichoic acid export membrane protein